MAAVKPHQPSAKRLIIIIRSLSITIFGTVLSIFVELEVFVMVVKINLTLFL